jgi:branched-chain amino acid transport system ATP-binding protein
MTADALLRVESLSAGYRDLQAIWGVDLTVGAGEITVLLGRNGAGKSTTLLTIAGMLRMLGGRVELGGEDISARPARLRVKMGLALVRESKRIFRRRTVEENLLIGGFIMPRGERQEALHRAYDQFPILLARRHQLAGGLSGGQQQMLAIAQALMPRPRVIMLDEPSAGLAPAIVKDVFSTLTRLRAEGVGVLLVEQLVDLAMSVADRVVLLDQGRVISTGADAGMPDLDKFREVYLGRRPSLPRSRSFVPLRLRRQSSDNMWGGGMTD